MKRFFYCLNVGCYACIALYLGWVAVSAVSSGYPWTVTCYNCGLCRQSCPLGLDPYGFVAAATAADADAYMQAANVKLLPHEARMLDAAMPVISADGKRMKAGAIPADFPADEEVYVLRMRAALAARYCILCGNSEKVCPIRLPVLDIIKGYRKGVLCERAGTVQRADVSGGGAAGGHSALMLGMRVLLRDDPTVYEGTYPGIRGGIEPRYTFGEKRVELHLSAMWAAGNWWCLSTTRQANSTAC